MVVQVTVIGAAKRRGKRGRLGERANHFRQAPHAGRSISRIMQSLAVAHTWHFHRRRSSSGHVWQGRFKSPVIETDEHLLTVMRYAESNPLRAKMVTDLGSWRWSSYAAHAGMGVDPLVTEAPAWAQLGANNEKRQAYWQRWLHTPQTERELSALRKSVVSGWPFGSDRWVKRMARLLGVPLEPRPRGRPRKAGKMN